MDCTLFVIAVFGAWICHREKAQTCCWTFHLLKLVCFLLIFCQIFSISLLTPILSYQLSHWKLQLSWDYAEVHLLAIYWMQSDQGMTTCSMHLYMLLSQDLAYPASSFSQTLITTSKIPQVRSSHQFLSENYEFSRGKGHRLFTCCFVRVVLAYQ